jgi:hypothetical protein
LRNRLALSSLVGAAVPKRFREFVELGLEFHPGLQNSREFRGLRPQGIDWFQ